MTATSAPSDHPSGAAPEAGRTPALTLMPKAAPARPGPPRHLADLSREERRAVATTLGQPAFRADQLARHYFARLAAPGDTTGMTDLPAAVRGTLVDALLPRLLTPSTTLTCDAGATRKTAWRTVDGAPVKLPGFTGTSIRPLLR